MTIKMTSWGETYELNITRTTYTNNGNLAVLATITDGEPFGAITVNTEYVLPEEFAAVDTNNMQCIVEVLKDNNIAKETGMYVQSGFCNYPVMKFNIANIPEE